MCKQRARAVMGQHKQYIRKLKNFAGYRLELLKLVHKALDSPILPSYVPLDTVKHLWSLQSGAATRLIIPRTAAPFKTLLPRSLMPFQQIIIRNCSDFKVYCGEVNAYLSNNICK